MTAPATDLPVRLTRKIVVTPTGCWQWVGATKSDGYGKVRRGPAPGKLYLVHRLVYELLVAPIPAGLTLDHECHNRDATCTGGRACAHRRCVNPDHLAPVTGAENTRRARAAVAKCPSGHAYDHDNTYLYRGRRYCRACRGNARAASRRGIRGRGHIEIDGQRIGVLPEPGDEPHRASLLRCQNVNEAGR